MGRIVYLRQVLEIKCSIDLRGCDRTVSEHFLYRAQVAGGLQYV